MASLEEEEEDDVAGLSIDDECSNLPAGALCSPMLAMLDSLCSSLSDTDKGPLSASA
jgi:hypothetical protein